MGPLVYAGDCMGRHEYGPLKALVFDMSVYMGICTNPHIYETFSGVTR